jgi:TPR repeat protein
VTDISKDLVSTAHYFKLSADQGNAFGQRRAGRSLRDGTDLSKDLILIGHYFKLSAGQGNADGQCCHGRYLTLALLLAVVAEA